MIQRCPLGATAWVVWYWTSGTPDAPAQARAALRCALDQVGFDDEAISDAVLAVSEFIANAIQHATGPYEMRLRRTVAEIVCEIEDRDPRITGLPTLSSTPLDAGVKRNCETGLEVSCGLFSEHGRGLHIVNELTKGAWGFRIEKRTKTAWLALPWP